MSHLGVFNADTPIFGNSLDQTRMFVLIKLHILLVHQLCGIYSGLRQFPFLILKRPYPRLHSVQHLYDQF
jgi:hypothetical protein